MRLLLLIGWLGCTAALLTAQNTTTAIQQIGADIQLIPLTTNTIIHRSYKVFEDYGRVSCNGLIYVVDSSLVIFDTPATEETTARLLEHFVDERGYTVEAVIINHFHEDCMAGIDSVHARGILTYASRKTISRCKTEGITPPKKKLGRKKILKIADRTVVNYHPGAAHSDDNIVSYLPTEQVLFGGCMLKAQGAGKGNLADASVENWSGAVERVQERFPQVQYVVPGHGHHGGPLLLQYTIDLFAEDRKK